MMETTRPRYGADGVKAWMNGPVRLATDPAPLCAGDLIAWDTWPGRAVVRLQWVDEFGHCGILSADGHSEFFERVPNDAELATAAEAAWWAEHARPAAPPYIND